MSYTTRIGSTVKHRCSRCGTSVIEHNDVSSFPGARDLGRLHGWAYFYHTNTAGNHWSPICPDCLGGQTA